MPVYHDTNSTILELLPDTGFAMHPPITLLEEYGVAPMDGAINEAELSTLDSVGNIIFAESSAADGPPDEQKSFSFRQYFFDLYSSHVTARQNSLQKKDFIRRIQEAVKNGPGCLFSNINILLLEIARANQLGIAAQELLDKEAAEELFTNLEGTLQLYYLCLLIGKDINLDVPAVPAGTDENVEENEGVVPDAIFDHLSFKNLLKKIIASEIDLKENKNLEKAVKLLQLPPDLAFKNGEKISAQVFKIKDLPFLKHTSTSIKESYAPIYLSEVFKCRRSFLYDLARGNISNKIMDEFHKVAKNNIKLLTKKIVLLKKYFSPSPKKMAVKKGFSQKPYPIVLIMDEKESQFIDPIGEQQYCAIGPLKWGKDIQTIATDTPANQKKLEAYLAEHKLAVTVITFAELQAINKGQNSLAAARQARQKTLQDQKERLQNSLDAYIKRIEGYKSSPSGKINFSSGFWWDPATRAVNRAANYYLAKQLYQELKDGKEVAVTFAKVAEKRAAIFHDKFFIHHNNPNFVDRGTNSRELNRILRMGR